MAEGILKSGEPTLQRLTNLLEWAMCQSDRNRFRINFRRPLKFATSDYLRETLANLPTPCQSCHQLPRPIRGPAPNG